VVIIPQQNSENDNRKNLLDEVDTRKIKSENRKKKTKRLKNSKKNSILNGSSNEDEQRKFYEEEQQPTQLPVVTSTGYSRGISV
jgi:hypothetical protein